MSEDIFDFGFSAVDIGELDVLQEAAVKLEESGSAAAKLEDQLSQLYTAVQPLLNNLKKDPAKDYIWWPQRLEKIEEFEAHLYKIYSGK